MANIDLTEREMPLIQRGIVDNCFEEGHYEYGIGVLDRLRTHRYKPFPLHVRQLIYIALYPPPSKPPGRANRADAPPPPSPTKAQLQRQKDDLWPKPASRPLSIALLNALVNTNSPESLMRGLPYYSYADTHGEGDVDPFREEKTAEDDVEDNSPLKHEVSAMQGRKDCWELLKEGLVTRKQVDRYRDEDEPDLHANEMHVVGAYAWPVLEWLIQVFEKDERRTKGQGKAPHSALLLCQIPSPRTKKGPRWDAETPLKVACACFLSDQRAPDHSYKYASSEKRFDLGTRLILLLVNLTLTKPPLLSPSHFLRSLVVRLPELPMTSLKALLTAIPSSEASVKVALLESYISQENGSNSITSQQMAATSTVPAPRAKPKFNGRGASRAEAPAVTSTVSTGPQDKEKDAYPMPTTETLLKLLASPLPSPAIPDVIDATSLVQPPPPMSPTPKISLAKFELVLVLFTLHVSGRLVDPDSRWMTAVREGRLLQSVQSGFTLRGRTTVVIEEDNEVKRHLSQTLELIRLWGEAYSGRV